MSNVTITCGGYKGTHFDSIRGIKSIGLEEQIEGKKKFVKRIVINGHGHGGTGGHGRGILTLKGDDDEFIEEIIVRSGSLIDYVKFVTNEGRSIEAGGSGGSEITITGKLLAIGGKANTMVDQLVFDLKNT